MAAFVFGSRSETKEGASACSKAPRPAKIEGGSGSATQLKTKEEVSRLMG